MIVSIFYMIVRLLVMGYGIYSLWDFMVTKKCCGLWSRIFILKEKKEKKEKTEDILPVNDNHSIVGNTTLVYLDAQPKKPEPIVEIEDEPEITDEDIEIEFTQEKNVAEIVGIDELERLSVPPLPTERKVETMSYNELLAVVDGLSEKATEDMQEKAADSLFQIKNTYLFDILSSSVNNSIQVAELLDKYYDPEGKPIGKKKQKPSGTEFNLSEYLNES